MRRHETLQRGSNKVYGRAVMVFAATVVVQKCAREMKADLTRGLK